MINNCTSATEKAHPNDMQCVQSPLLVSTDLCGHAQERTCLGGRPRSTLSMALI